MNNNIVNTATAALNKVLDVIPSVHSIGEKIFLSEQVHTMRAHIDTQDDALTDDLERLDKENKSLTAQLAEENDPRVRANIYAAIEANDAEKDAIKETKAKLEALDDEFHDRSHSYTKAISALYSKAHSLLQSACSALNSLIEVLTGLFKKREAM